MTDKLFKQCLIALWVAALMLVYTGRYSDIDVRLADWMYDFSEHKFPWKENWFAAVFMHQWVKGILIGLGLILFASMAINQAFALDRFIPATLRTLYVVILSYALVPLVVGVLKSHSIHSCPWSLERYGGSAPYLRLFDALPAGVAAGHCFPAGHASSALWLAAFAIFWLPGRRKTAALVFFAGSIPGLMLGWVQQMRGAHFLTHTLWAMWISSLVILILARLFRSGCESVPNRIKIPRQDDRSIVAQRAGARRAAPNATQPSRPTTSPRQPSGYFPT